MSTVPLCPVKSLWLGVVPCRPPSLCGSLCSSSAWACSTFLHAILCAPPRCLLLSDGCCPVPGRRHHMLSLCIRLFRTRFRRAPLLGGRRLWTCPTSVRLAPSFQILCSFSAGLAPDPEGFALANLTPALHCVPRNYMCDAPHRSCQFLHGHRPLPSLQSVPLRRVNGSLLLPPRGLPPSSRAGLSLRNEVPRYPYLGYALRVPLPIATFALMASSVSAFFCSLAVRIGHVWLLPTVPPTWAVRTLWTRRPGRRFPAGPTCLGSSLAMARVRSTVSGGLHSFGRPRLVRWL